jgi:hypothetical protein
MKMVKGKVLLFALLLIFATSLYAGEVHNCNSEVYYSTGCTSMYVLVCPAGDFTPIAEGCGGTDDYIRIEVKDDTDAGIPGIPWSDYWLDACDTAQELYLCAGSIEADSLTNGDGETTLSDPIAAGGCILSGGVYVAVQNVPIEGSGCSGPICLDMMVKSPDLTKDGSVGLSDFGVFGDAFGTEDGVTPPPGKAYDPCCDYNNDSRVNLSDLGYFGDHWQHECQ